jgi:AcrR family transcriptional regulator
VSADATKTTKAPDRRPYRSELRELQAAATRRAVVDAACGLFVANGWAATGMREVAAAAGVAVETVYSHFSSKRGLLQAVLDTAVVGDDAPVALAERDDFLALGKGRRPARIRAAARGLTAVQVRTASVNVLLRQAAPADEEAAEMLRLTRERQRIDVASAFELLVGRAPSRPECDGLWAIASPELYLLLVEESGWSPEEYEAWIAELMERVIPRA